MRTPPHLLKKGNNNRQSLFRKVVDLARNFWVRRNSSAYIKYLRSKGVSIGEQCIIRHPSTCRIDITRPALITIGDRVDMNMNFQILTHDWSCFVFRNKYHDFVNS